MDEDETTDTEMKHRVGQRAVVPKQKIDTGKGTRMYQKVLVPVSVTEVPVSVTDVHL